MPVAISCSGQVRRAVDALGQWNIDVPGGVGRDRGAGGKLVARVVTAGDEPQHTDHDRNHRSGSTGDDRPAVPGFGSRRGELALSEGHSGTPRVQGVEVGVSVDRGRDLEASSRVGLLEQTHHLVFGDHGAHTPLKRQWSASSGTDPGRTRVRGSAGPGAAVAAPRRARSRAPRQRRRRTVAPTPPAAAPRHQCHQAGRVQPGQGDARRPPPPTRRRPGPAGRRSSAGGAPTGRAGRCCATDVRSPGRPHQRLFPGRHLVEAAPHGEERVRDRVVHRVDSNSPAAELTDRPVEPGMRLREPHLIGRPIGAC
jgi:hypothetical protein